MARWFHTEYSIVQAHTAEAGLELARSLRPACVILDHQLSDGNGMELLPTLQQIGSQVVFLTGYGDERTAAKAIQLGALEYLPKDEMKEEELRASIERAVQRTRTIERVRTSFMTPEELLVGGTECAAPRVEAALHECGKLLGVLRKRTAVAETDELDGIEEALDDLRETFSGLLSLARVGNDAVQEAIDLEELAASVVEALPHQDGLDIQLEGLPTFDGNRERIAEMLRTILRNTVRNGGRQLTRILIVGRLVNDDLHLSIRDNGRALGPAIRSALTEQDPQMSDPNLEMARKVARAQRGELWVESELGVGTTVHVYLPNAA